MENDTFLTFNDILLMPQYSEISSRDEVDIGSSIGEGNWKRELKTPLISAPMDTVTDGNFAATMKIRGGIGIIHRYMSIHDQVNEVYKAISFSGGAANLKNGNIGAAIGATGDYLDRFDQLVRAGADVICIDVAHGHHLAVRKALINLSSHPLRDRVHIMAGNIASAAAYRDLSDWGADSIRTGIGGGSVCSTRINTGHGAPNIGVLQHIDAERRQNGGASIILDGGIKTSGDIVKALAFGADAVMCGGMLSGHKETPGKIVHETKLGWVLEKLLGEFSQGKLASIRDNSRRKEFRGMASKSAQVAWRGKKPAADEGISTFVKYKGSVHGLISEIQGHIRSGFSYSGATNIKEFYDKAEYIVQTYAGQIESSPHIHK